MANRTRLPEILAKHERDLLADWLRELASSGVRRDDLMKESDLRSQCGDFLRLLRGAAQSGNFAETTTPDWAPVRELLAEVSTNRAKQGFTPREIALFIFSFKQPLFTRLREEVTDGQALVDEIWTANQLLDALGLWTTEVFQKTREQIIARQQQELLELSTPVVKLWEGILALPMIGTLDSGRTQVVMEALLQRITDTGSQIAILDITGVPTVDTLTAQHLLKTVAAARLMGAECIISGIRPQIAQTIVHLAIDLGNVATKATLADAFQLALQRLGATVTRTVPART